ncbi:MAG: amidohydrolase [Actinomycetota bacterium]|nr:amidohydrolase [Actinomycetota bacterium]
MATSPDPTSSATAVLAGLGEVRSWAADLYRDLHAHPELSHQEHATAEKVATRLVSSGIEVHRGVGGTGVVGLIRNGAGPTVLLRADMDALPVAEATGLDYASQARGEDPSGNEVPVMHACGHDVHVACLLGAAHLLASTPTQWSGTVIALFQPAEETGDGARAMVADHLDSLVPKPDVALAQHVLPAPAGLVGTHEGPTLSAADSMRITLHGRGAHGSMPQAAVDPVVLAATIVVRLQTIVAREMRPGEPVVVTVGSLRAGTKSNVIADHAEVELNVRTYSETTRDAVLSAIRRIVDAECQASRCPRPADYELFDRFPLTTNDPGATATVAAAFSAHFGERARTLPMQSASEDFSDLPNAFGIPSCYWGIGGTDPDAYRQAEAAGRLDTDIPVNHSAAFAPVIEPTLSTGIEAMVVAALAWLSERPEGAAAGPG